MTNKHMKRTSILVIRKILIKTTKRFYYTPTRMAKIEKTDDTKCWQRYEATVTLTND